MHDGQILEMGSPEQIFKNPQSKEGSQFLAREFIAQSVDIVIRRSYALDQQ